MYVFMPLMAVVFAFAMPLTHVLTVLTLSLPVLAFLTYIVRPKSLDKVSFIKSVTPLITLVLASITLYAATHTYTSLIPAWVAGIIASIPAYREMREIDVMRRESLELLKDVTELMRTGYSIPSALRYITHTQLSKKFSNVMVRRLKHALSLMDMGTPLTVSASLIKTPSFLFRYTLFALGLMSECGGGTYETLHKLHEGLTKLIALEENVRKVSWLFDAIALCNLLVIVWVCRSLSSMFNVSTVSQLGFPLPWFGRVDVELVLLLSTISMLSYSLISTVIRRGVVSLEPRSALFVAMVVATALLFTYLP